LLSGLLEDCFGRKKASSFAMICGGLMSLRAGWFSRRGYLLSVGKNPITQNNMGFPAILHNIFFSSSQDPHIFPAK
jgi:hypothetical protein